VVGFGDYVGPGYSLPTPGMVESLLIELMRKGYFERDSNILFVHTGGLPISAYL
jgi:D-cysteine desulfhydrase